VTDAVGQVWRPQPLVSRPESSCPAFFWFIRIMRTSCATDNRSARSRCATPSRPAGRAGVDGWLDLPRGYQGGPSVSLRCGVEPLAPCWARRSRPAGRAGVGPLTIPTPKGSHTAAQGKERHPGCGRTASVRGRTASVRRTAHQAALP